MTIAASCIRMSKSSVARPPEGLGAVHRRVRVAQELLADAGRSSRTARSPLTGVKTLAAIEVERCFEPWWTRSATRMASLACADIARGGS